MCWSKFSGVQSANDSWISDAARSIFMRSASAACARFSSVLSIETPSTWGGLPSPDGSGFLMAVIQRVWPPASMVLVCGMVHSCPPAKVSRSSSSQPRACSASG